MTKVHRSCGAILSAHQYCGPRRALLAFPEAFLSPRALSVCNFASETSYGWLGQTSIHSSQEPFTKQGQSKSPPKVQGSHSQEGLLPPTPSAPWPGNHETPSWRQNNHCLPNPEPVWILSMKEPDHREVMGQVIVRC